MSIFFYYSYLSSYFHQFFLSKRSVYVLVLDGRRDERPEYWLQHIETFGGDSPVLVVLNKYDANPSFDINRPFLQKKYPGIIGFYRTSCSTDYGLDEFKERCEKNPAFVAFIIGEYYLSVDKSVQAVKAYRESLLANTGYRKDEWLIHMAKSRLLDIEKSGERISLRDIN